MTILKLKLHTSSALTHHSLKHSVGTFTDTTVFISNANTFLTGDNYMALQPTDSLILFFFLFFSLKHNWVGEYVTLSLCVCVLLMVTLRCFEIKLCGCNDGVCELWKSASVIIIEAPFQTASPCVYYCGFICNPYLYEIIISPKDHHCLSDYNAALLSLSANLNHL